MGYLLEKVLRRQPEAVQSFLLHTAILDRLCASGRVESGYARTIGRGTPVPYPAR